MKKFSIFSSCVLAAAMTFAAYGCGGGHKDKPAPEVSDAGVLEDAGHHGTTDGGSIPALVTNPENEEQLNYYLANGSSVTLTNTSLGDPESTTLTVKAGAKLTIGRNSTLWSRVITLEAGAEVYVQDNAQFYPKQLVLESGALVQVEEGGRMDVEEKTKLNDAYIRSSGDTKLGDLTLNGQSSVSNTPGAGGGGFYLAAGKTILNGNSAKIINMGTMGLDDVEIKAGSILNGTDTPMTNNHDHDNPNLSTGRMDMTGAQAYIHNFPGWYMTIGELWMNAGVIQNDSTEENAFFINGECKKTDGQRQGQGYLSGWDTEGCAKFFAPQQPECDGDETDC